MKWFYNLKSTYRILITIGSWLPFLILAGIFGSQGTEELTDVQGGLGFLFLVLGVVFTVFAVKASSKEKKERGRITSEQKSLQLKEEQQTVAIVEEKRKAEVIARRAEVDKKIALCLANTRTIAEKARHGGSLIRVVLVGNRNEAMQDSLVGIKQFYGVTFEYDSMQDKYLASSGDGIISWNDIGYLAKKDEKYIKDNDYVAFVDEIDFDDNDKYVITVGIVPQSVVSITLPLYTKVVGVTYENRQDYLGASVIGDVLSIEHKGSEKYPESTEVINSRIGKCLGYIKKELAFSLLNEFGKSFVLIGEVADITGGKEGESLGCNVRIDGVK